MWYLIIVIYGLLCVLSSGMLEEGQQRTTPMDRNNNYSPMLNLQCQDNQNQEP